MLQGSSLFPAQPSIRGLFVPLQRQLVCLATVDNDNILLFYLARMIISKEALEEIAMGSMGVAKRERTFKAHFIFPPEVVAGTWNELERQQLKPDKAQPLHLLWFLYWVKVYPSDDVGANFCRCRKRDTFANWTLRIGIAVSNLRLVSHFNICI